MKVGYYMRILYKLNGKRISKLKLMFTISPTLIQSLTNYFIQSNTMSEDININNTIISIQRIN